MGSAVGRVAEVVMAGVLSVVASYGNNTNFSWKLFPLKMFNNLLIA